MPLSQAFSISSWKGRTWTLWVPIHEAFLLGLGLDLGHGGSGTSFLVLLPTDAEAGVVGTGEPDLPHQLGEPLVLHRALVQF